MTSADSIKHTNEKKYTTASGKILYGGGGITPDVFVPYDTTMYTKDVMHAMMYGTLTRFVYKNFLRNEKEFRQYSSPKQFDQNYQVNDETLNELKAYAEKDSVSLNLKDQQEKSILKREIKALTAREIWRTEGYYQVINQFDPTVNKALELMKPNAQLFSKK
jgi:carboxyl-terminal processing protease